MKLNYIIIPLIVFLTAFLGSFFTERGMSWYETLELPSFTPPGFVISIVWTVIFFLSLISALLFWNKAKKRKRIALLFLLNAFLNLLWSFVFFNQHLIFLSILEMILLNITTLLLIYLLIPVSKLASALLVPYFLWVGFATYLAYSIHLLN